MKTDYIYQGDSLDILKTFSDECIDCVVTSPPYWGLRDYGTAQWIGGDPNCNHMRDTKKSDKTITGHRNFDKMNGVGDAIYKVVCKKCGAIRIDNQLGLEKTPEEYVEKMVLLFREIKRVLKKEGTVWLNLGDSYNGTKQGNTETNKNKNVVTDSFKKQQWNKLKPKDLIGIPWRIAFALQADGWYLRQDIIWHKPNPMPESIKDRCTKSHEYIFLLTKSSKYYFDADAIKEKSVDPESYTGKRLRYKQKISIYDPAHAQSIQKGMGKVGVKYEKRNKRSVWTVNTKPFKEAHFATYPPELITPCIKAGCPKDGIVLDPFMGAGTTALVAKKFGRKYIGIELNPEYIKIANKRLSQTYLDIG